MYQVSWPTTEVDGAKRISVYGTSDHASAEARIDDIAEAEQWPFWAALSLALLISVPIWASFVFAFFH